MSNDLIDREKTIFFICDVLDRYRVDVGDKMAKSLINSVKSQPTAYDVDKVVERLEILSDRADDKIMEQEGSEQYWDGFGDGIDKAIKILKSGGIERNR